MGWFITYGIIAILFFIAIFAIFKLFLSLNGRLMLLAFVQAVFWPLTVVQFVIWAVKVRVGRYRTLKGSKIEKEK